MMSMDSYIHSTSSPRVIFRQGTVALPPPSMSSALALRSRSVSTSGNSQPALHHVAAHPVAEAAEFGVVELVGLVHSAFSHPLQSKSKAPEYAR